VNDFVYGQKAEALESGTKQFEELEFCQLEEESSLDEKKEAQSSQLLQERADYHCSVAKRKVGYMPPAWDYCMCPHNIKIHVDSQEKVAALEAQAKQLGFQASQDCERLAKDRTVTLQLLRKVSRRVFVNLLKSASHLQRCSDV